MKQGICVNHCEVKYLFHHKSNRLSKRKGSFKIFTVIWIRKPCIEQNETGWCLSEYQRERPPLPHWGQGASKLQGYPEDYQEHYQTVFSSTKKQF